MTEVTVLGISGSPRKNGNTENMVKEALLAAKSMGDVKTEFISLAEKKVNPCTGCNRCYGFKIGATPEKFCYTHDDDGDEIYKAMLKSDGIIIGTPVYAFDVSSKLKALLERGAPFCPYTASEVSGLFRMKVVGVITVGFMQHGGQEHTAAAIHRWTLMMFSIPVGAIPFPQDPPPYSSALGGFSATFCSSDSLGERGYSADTTRVNPPIPGVFNERSVRNLGRSVALLSKIIKSGMKEEGESFPKIPLVKFPNSYIKEGSYLDKIRKGEKKPPDYQKV
ncbi:MAG: flavodoxin family protein [Candidatus Syntropharchaeia archaeon]